MHSRLFHCLTRAWVLTVAAVTLGGCATGPAALGPLAALQEAKTRAQVERQASHDPFPSPADVGLK